MSDYFNVVEVPSKEYKIAQSNLTASTAKQIAFANTNSRQKILLTADGDDVVVKFGSDNTVAADTTITSGALADGNFTLIDGKTYELVINPTKHAYVSGKALTGTSGFLILNICS